jgi:hypothetical protein
MVVVAVFIFTIVVFAVYDAIVQRRQHKVLATAKQTAAIVKSLLHVACYSTSYLYGTPRFLLFVWILFTFVDMGSC